MRIAVIGAGSSGLITLKYLIDQFPSAELVCYEKGDSVRGCWGNQRPDFISTSTRYTTQFSCFRETSAEVSPEKDYSEFYRGGAFGDYLERFADRFDLLQKIEFGVALTRFDPAEPGWSLTLNRDGHDHEEVAHFDALFLCTGLVNSPIPIDSAVPVAKDPEAIRNSTVVVVGGGESAADIVNFLAKPEHGNRVYLSLRSGIRVSPRYHPIRGVPSDFLRNRLLLSFDKGARNRVGERFVTFRIRFNRLLSRWFPHRDAGKTPDERAEARRRLWDLKLKARAKGGLFNVFHNKSDDFLNAVGDGRIDIIGPAIDEHRTTYWDFDQTASAEINPDILVRSTGYRSRLPDFSGGRVHLRDFYHGCVHSQFNTLFLIGFARPIIGNIPSISEMQARYAVSVLAGETPLPADVQARQAAAAEALAAEYPAIDTENVYPVEHYPYCDVLADEMGILPHRRDLPSFRTWVKWMLAPASTTHYSDRFFEPDELARQTIYTPPLLNGILVALKIWRTPFRWIGHWGR